MNNKIEKPMVDMNQQLRGEFEERLFARMCQLLEKNEYCITIPGSKFDLLFMDIEKELLNLPSEENKKEGDYMPFFITPELLQRMKLLRVVERYLKEEETIVSDIVGAVINPVLCRGKSIDIKEIAEEDSIYIALISPGEEDI